MVKERRPRLNSRPSSSRKAVITFSLHLCRFFVLCLGLISSSPYHLGVYCHRITTWWLYSGAVCWVSWEKSRSCDRGSGASIWQFNCVCNLPTTVIVTLFTKVTTPPELFWRYYLQGLFTTISGNQWKATIEILPFVVSKLLKCSSWMLGDINM